MTHASRLKNIFLFLFLSAALLDIAILFRIKSTSHLKSLIPPQGNIAIAGSVVCLPHRNPNGPQTMECAYGLKDAQGRYFGLSGSDPQHKDISTVGMNTPVLVRGTFSVSSSTQYPTIGIIQVKSISATVSPTF